MTALRLTVVSTKRTMKLVHLDINDNNGKTFSDLWLTKLYKIILRCTLYIRNMIYFFLNCVFLISETFAHQGFQLQVIVIFKFDYWYR